MAAVKLTDERVASEPPVPGKEIILSDSEAKGLRVKITPAGNRVYFCQYTSPADKRRKKYTLGTFGDINTKAAREMFRRVMDRVADGQDPQGEKMIAAVLMDKEPTLTEAWKLYDEKVLRSEVKPNTANERRRIWNRDVPATWKKKRLADVTKANDPLERKRRISRADMSELRERMRDRPGACGHLFRILKAFFNWCEGEGQLTTPNSNPLHKFKMPTVGKRSFVFRPEQIRAFAHALAQEEQRGWPSTIQCLWFLTFTGFRSEEARTLKWEYIDFERRVVSLPETKTGASERVLSMEAIQVLERAKLLQTAFPSPYVFPSPKDRTRPVQNLNKALERVCTLAGLPYGTKLKGGLFVHGLRHNFGGYGAKLTGNAVAVRDMLGHKQTGTTDGYMKIADNSLTEAADKTTGAMAEDMKTNVVRFER